jgi:ABC-type sulfate transport system substrate-binding protein
LKGNPKNIEDWPIEQKVRKDGTLVINFLNG